MKKDNPSGNTSANSNPNSDKGAADKYKAFDSGRYDFMGLAKVMGILTVVVTLACIAIMMVKGFRYGVDFAGGTEMQVKFVTAIDAAKVRVVAENQGIGGVTVQEFGKGNEFLIRFEVIEGKNEKETAEINSSTVSKMSAAIRSSFQTEGADVVRVDSVGAQVGSELKRNGMLAMFYGIVLVLIYIGLRFDFRFSAGAVICLVHDVIVAVGVYVLLGKEVNVQILAAVLTIIGYSLNDTIVNYDRVRENMALFRGQPLVKIMNRSINDCLSRTILTSLTTFLTTLALYIFATGVIVDFALVFGIGVILGTYSSIYIACPLVLVCDRYFPSKT